MQNPKSLTLALLLLGSSDASGAGRKNMEAHTKR